MQGWCNGSTRVSKAFSLGSNPSLCVLLRDLTEEAYKRLIDLAIEVGSTPTASANLEAIK